MLSSAFSGFGEVFVGWKPTKPIPKYIDLSTSPMSHSNSHRRFHSTKSHNKIPSTLTHHCCYTHKIPRNIHVLNLQTLSNYEKIYFVYVGIIEKRIIWLMKVHHSIILLLNSHAYIYPTKHHYHLPCSLVNSYTRSSNDEHNNICTIAIGI